MRLKTLLAASSVAAVIGLATPALAAYANTNVNVRATPNGTIVDVLRQGERATVVNRNGGWCQVNKPGPDGWVACRYLSDVNERPRARDRGYDRDYYDRDRRYYRDRGYYRRGPSVEFGFSTPHFGFRIGDHDRPRYRWRNWW